MNIINKDCSFHDTIGHINSILKELDIDIQQQWTNASSIGPYSLHIHPTDIHCGTNGKGITPEAATTSALGEFLERLQNEILFRSSCTLTIPKLRTLAPDCVKVAYNSFTLPEKQLIVDFWKKAVADPNTFQDEDIIFKDILSWESPQDNSGEILCVPYYNPFSSSIYRIPISFKYATGSNGMAAGNTPSEALVQGISEICERYTYFQALKLNMEPVQVSDSCIQKLSNEVWKQKNNLISQYKCNVKFIRFPNAIIPTIGCIIENVEGRYSLSLGTHPFYNIALSRAFTESLQGKLVHQLPNKIVDKDIYSYSDTVDNRRTLFSIGVGIHPNSFFDCSLDRSENWIYENQDCQSNKSLLKRLLEIFNSLNIQILFRNVGYLGFPAFHIIIPGYSNIVPLSRELRLQWEAAGVAFDILTAPSINEKQLMFLLEYSEFLLKRIDSHRSLSAICPVLGTNFPDYPQDLYLFLVLGYFHLNQFQKAIVINNTIRRYLLVNSPDNQPLTFKQFSDYLESSSQNSNDNKKWNEFFVEKFLRKMNRTYLLNSSTALRIDLLQKRLRQKAQESFPAQTASDFDL